MPCEQRNRNTDFCPFPASFGIHLLRKEKATITINTGWNWFLPQVLCDSFYLHLLTPSTIDQKSSVINFAFVCRKEEKLNRQAIYVISRTAKVNEP